MKKAIERVPLPSGCVSLGFAGLAVLMKKDSPGIMGVCLFISMVFLCVLLAKLILFPQALKQLEKDSVGLSVLCAGCMSIMLLSSFAFSVSPLIGRILWGVGIATHLILMLYFTRKHAMRMDFSDVYGCWYIPYVGIAVCAIPSRMLGVDRFAKVSVYFAVVCFLILTAMLVFRQVCYPKIPKGAKPLLSICAAPASLCVAGYLQSEGNPNTLLASVLYLLSILLYVVALANCISILVKNREFLPSHGAFTFPFVISATASRLVSNLGVSSWSAIGRWIFPFQLVIAAGLCVFVSWEFMMYIWKSPESQ